MFPALKFPKLRHSSYGKVSTDRFADVRERAFRDHDYFVKEFFYGADKHFWGDYSEMHQWFVDLEQEPERRATLEVVAAPRGNAKTTWRVLFKAIHAILYGYHPFILIIGYSQAESIDKVKDIRDELANNERLIEVYGKLIKGKVAAKGFITTNGIRVEARSKGGQVRGLKYRQHRPSLVICDDIEDLEGVQTPEQRAKTEAWFFKDVMGVGGPSGKMSVQLCGTVLNDESLLAKLLKSPGWKARKFQAIKSWATRQDLWDEWERIYCDLDNPSAIDDARAYYEANQAAMDEGVEVLWPSGETYYDLMVYKIKFGLASLYSEKQNDPYDPTKQILDPDRCARFQVYRPGDPEWVDSLGDEGFAVVRNDTGKAWHSRDLKVIAFYDPAMAKTKESDYGAVVVCAQDPNGYIYVLDCWLKKQPPTQQINACFGLHAQWGFDALYVENVGFQDLLKPLFAEAQKLHVNKLRIIGVGQHSNKEARIGTLEPYFSAGWILFNQKTNPELYSQLRLFPTANHDDGPDALHGCVSRLRHPRGGITTSGKERTSV